MFLKRRLSLSQLFLAAIIAIAMAVNFVGALGPELGFDALWYHLTIPKLYLSAGGVFHIPGGLLYYSEMPRLTEMIYFLSFRLFPNLQEIGPHFLSWAAGIWVTVILFKLSRKYLSVTTSLLIILVFYATPLVGWLSGSAYIDLVRTFFEILALYLLIKKKILPAGLAAGLAVGTKTLALGSLLPLLVICYIQSKSFRSCTLFLVSCIWVITPWFLSAYLTTGYPLFPIGAGVLDSTHNITLSRELFPTQDPISPIYVIILPFILPVIKNRKLIVILFYCLIAYFVWYLTPHTGGGRFILPYLPVFAFLVGFTIENLRSRFFQTLLVTSILMVSLANVSYRLVVASRLIPYLSGRQTKSQYLCQNLDFKTAVFVDCDGWFGRNIKPTDLVFVAGVHNLYYLNFPFVHKSWYRGEKVNFLLTWGPEDDLTQSLFPVAMRRLVYSNQKTGINLFAL